MAVCARVWVGVGVCVCVCTKLQVIRTVSQVTSSFQDDFLIEATDPLPSDAGLPLKLLYGLDAEEEGSIAINLLPLVMGVGEAGEGVKGEGVRAMAARFHLLRVCEQAINQNLEGIDALLGE